MEEQQHTTIRDICIYCGNRDADHLCQDRRTALVALREDLEDAKERLICVEKGMKAHAELIQGLLQFVASVKLPLPQDKQEASRLPEGKWGLDGNRIALSTLSDGALFFYPSSKEYCIKTSLWDHDRNQSNHVTCIMIKDGRALDLPKGTHVYPLHIYGITDKEELV